MADNYTMGLLGQQNPILQAAQQQNQQSAQLRNVAAEGIVNRISQDYQKKIGAQLKTYANYMESKDPFIFQKGAEGMYSLMGEEMPPDIMERQQEVNLAYSELNRREGKIPPQEFMTLANDVLARFGSLPTGMGERAQQAVETEALGQAAGLPPDDPLLRAGTAGVDVVKSKLTDDPTLDKILARMVESGELTIDEAYEHKRKAAPSTTVNVDMTQRTKGDLEADIIGARRNVMALDEIDKLYKPEFLQYAGQGKAWLQEKGSRLGVGTPTEFLENRTAWMAQAKSFSNEYRKHITGVAGGEKEFNEILKAIPDPDRDGPAVFEAKIKQTKIWATALDKWLTETRQQGLTINQTKKILESQPKQKDFNERYNELESSGLKGDDIFKQLHKEGY